MKIQTLGVFIVTGLLLCSCEPKGLLIFTPTFFPTSTAPSTRTPRPTRTVTTTLTPSPTLTRTLTATVTRTLIPTRTPTYPAGIGAQREAMLEFFRGVDFKFTPADYVKGELITVGYSPSGFTTLILRGGPGTLNSAEIQILTSGETAGLSSDYWQAFLGFTTPDGDWAAKWVMENIPRAGLNGRVESMISYVTIILEVEKDTLRISVNPNH